VVMATTTPKLGDASDARLTAATLT